MQTPAGFPENGLSVKASIRGDRVAVELTADNVGHRVPTGFIDRHLVLAVEAFDDAGRALPLITGPSLPEAAMDLKGVPGKLYAKLAHDPATGRPLPFWLAPNDPLDSRLFPGETDRITFAFARPVGHVRIRLIYRRQWPVAGERDNAIVVVDQRGAAGR